MYLDTYKYFKFRWTLVICVNAPYKVLIYIYFLFKTLNNLKQLNIFDFKMIYLLLDELSSFIYFLTFVNYQAKKIIIFFINLIHVCNAKYSATVSIVYL